MKTEQGGRLIRKLRPRHVLGDFSLPLGVVINRECDIGVLQNVLVACAVEQNVLQLTVAEIRKRRGGTCRALHLDPRESRRSSAICCIHRGYRERGNCTGVSGLPDRGKSGLADNRAGWSPCETRLHGKLTIDQCLDIGAKIKLSARDGNKAASLGQKIAVFEAGNTLQTRQLRSCQRRWDAAERQQSKNRNEPLPVHCTNPLGAI